MPFPLSLLESSTTLIFNRTVKTLVHLESFTLPFFPRLHIMPSLGDFKQGFKIRLRDAPKPFQKALRNQLRLASASVTGLERFWTPKWFPKTGPCGFLEALKNVIFSVWTLRKPPEWILEAIWTAWGWVLNNSSKRF